MGPVVFQQREGEDKDAPWDGWGQVRQAQGNWLEFALPNVFFASTAVLLLSSVLLHLSFKDFLKGNEKSYKLFLVGSLVLGFAFLALQYQGWQSLYSIGVDLKGNPGCFFRVFVFMLNRP